MTPMTRRELLDAVAEGINKSGVIHDRLIQIFPEDSQTSPEAAVRAARKLLAILGTTAEPSSAPSCSSACSRAAASPRTSFPS